MVAITTRHRQQLITIHGMDPEADEENPPKINPGLAGLPYRV